MAFNLAFKKLKMGHIGKGQTIEPINNLFTHSEYLKHEQLASNIENDSKQYTKCNTDNSIQ